MKTRSRRQTLFRNLVLGTLIYSVVIGFFNDYTNILATTSYSTTFALAFVLQCLTELTLALKGWVVARIRNRGASSQRLAVGLSVWAIMFFSKFVFLAVVERVFGDDVNFSSFFGIFVVIAVMMIAFQTVDRVFEALGDDATVQVAHPD